LESPLEQCISDSLARNKDSGITSVGDLFSLVPSGVPKPAQTIVEESEPQPISSPDSFSDFFTALSGKYTEFTCKMPWGSDVVDGVGFILVCWVVVVTIILCYSSLQAQEPPEQVT